MILRLLSQSQAATSADTSASVRERSPPGRRLRRMTTVANGLPHTVVVYGASGGVGTQHRRRVFGHAHPGRAQRRPHGPSRFRLPRLRRAPSMSVPSETTSSVAPLATLVCDLHLSRILQIRPTRFRHPQGAHIRVRGQQAYRPGLLPCPIWAQRRVMASSSNLEFDFASTWMSVRRISSDVLTFFSGLPSHPSP